MRTLAPVQKAGLAASAGHSGFAYYMEQGLGKTLTTLQDFDNLFQKREATRLVVVSPNSFKSGWVEEMEKWKFDFEPHIFESGSRSNLAFTKHKFIRPPALIINYEAIRSAENQELIQSFVAGKNAMIAFDESIQLATHNSQQTRAAIALAKEFAFSRILSGKPTKQGPHDLWGQMRAIRQLNGKNFFAFKTAFCKMGGFKMKQVVGAQNEEILAELIEPHVFRALKVDWTDLPPKVYTTREYKMTAEMQRLYTQMEDEFVLWLENGDNVTVDAAITKYMKLAQIQCGFIFDENKNVHWLVPPERNPRLNTLLDILDVELTGKATIPYVHRPVFDVLYNTLTEKGYNPAYIRGGMEPHEIVAQKAKFNGDPTCRVILLQTRAAKYGHTLLGDQEHEDLACATSIFFENSYSLDDRSQIEDRNHRHGQESDSVLYIDICGTQLDRNAIKALQRKESIYQAIFANIRAKPV